MVDQAVYGCTCPAPVVANGEWTHVWREGCAIHGPYVRGEKAPLNAPPGRTIPKSTNQVLAELAVERWHQDNKWGQQNWPDGTSRHNHARHADKARSSCDRAHRDGTVTWFHILREEFWEAMAETDTAKLRGELVQVAAVAINWIEAIDRRPT